MYDLDDLECEIMPSDYDDICEDALVYKYDDLGTTTAFGHMSETVST
jgi:hypothetical protein